MCDVVTGQCPCSPGVGGADCSSCRNGYYNFTAEGCSGERMMADTSHDMHMTYHVILSPHSMWVWCGGSQHKLYF